MPIVKIYQKPATFVRNFGNANFEVSQQKLTYYFRKKTWNNLNFITRNSSGDEIVNVNFRNDDIVHALQNTIDSCMNSATDRRSYVLEHRFTKFSEIRQCNGHYAIQGHSRLPILVPTESSYTTSY